MWIFEAENWLNIIIHNISIILFNSGQETVLYNHILYAGMPKITSKSQLWTMSQRVPFFFFLACGQPTYPTPGPAFQCWNPLVCGVRFLRLQNFVVSPLFITTKCSVSPFHYKCFVVSAFWDYKCFVVSAFWDYKCFVVSAFWDYKYL